jgi:hypothetical protein
MSADRLTARAPRPTSGWTVADPVSQGIDGTKLEELSGLIEANSPTRYSLLIRNGYLAFERYYRGSQAGCPRDPTTVGRPS